MIVRKDLVLDPNQVWFYELAVVLNLHEKDGKAEEKTMTRESWHLET